jgi:hypothetical protein
MMELQGKKEAEARHDWRQNLTPWSSSDVSPLSTQMAQKVKHYEGVGKRQSQGWEEKDKKENTLEKALTSHQLSHVYNRINKPKYNKIT